jgi:hypothetical protein
MQLEKNGAMPKLWNIPFREDIMSRCISEAIKYWEEKNAAKDVA